MSNPHPPREADEKILAMLLLRHQGRSTRHIAATLQTTQQNIIFHTTKVLKADLAESGEPVGTVRRGYW